MRKKCRRKVWALVDPITYAKEGAAITKSAALDKLRLLELAAIESFAKGSATKEDWRAIVDMLNLAETMANGKSGRKVGPEVKALCVSVTEELKNCAERFERTGRFGLTGPGLQMVRELYEYHDLQRTSISRREYETWIALTAAHIKSAHNVVEIV